MIGVVTRPMDAHKSVPSWVIVEAKVMEFAVLSTEEQNLIADSRVKYQTQLPLQPDACMVCIIVDMRRNKRVHVFDAVWQLEEVFDEVVRAKWVETLMGLNGKHVGVSSESDSPYAAYVC